MTLNELTQQREELCFSMIEASGRKLKQLEEELLWVEELIREKERIDEEE